ncbi:MAG: PilZ domain-containing protein [Gemmataceae bacterium]|nr:PilZ domain-containing protein [Gemmataceae bacterium]
MTEPVQNPDMPALVHAERLHLRLPSRPDWIEPAVEYLKLRAVLCGACHESRSGKLMVALHEALSNAVVHGNLELSSELKERGDDSFARELAVRTADPALAARRVDVHVDYDGERCLWTIIDQGKGFDVQATLSCLESDDPEILLASGRGILMMRSFLDEIRYEDGGRRCLLTLLRGSGIEKRQHARAALQHPLRVVPIRRDGSIDWDAAYEAVSKNLSAEGMALLQARLATSDRILIGLGGDEEPLYVPVEVRHCRNVGGDVVEVGCRFRTPGPEMTGPLGQAQEAIAKLLNQLDAPQVPAEERRTQVRVGYNERVEVLTPSRPEPLAGFTRDLSRGGIAFIAAASLPLEPCVLSLLQPDGTSLRVRAQVIRCVRVQEGFYDVAARFLELDESPR